MKVRPTSSAAQRARVDEAMRAGHDFLVAAIDGLDERYGSADQFELAENVLVSLSLSNARSAW